MTTTSPLNVTRQTINLLCKDLHKVLKLVLREETAAKTLMADVNTRVGTLNAAIQAVDLDASDFSQNLT